MAVRQEYARKKHSARKIPWRARDLLYGIRLRRDNLGQNLSLYARSSLPPQANIELFF